MYNILIVDDEYYICEGLRRKISQLGHSSVGDIRTALSGEAALELIKTYKPQIVFTDIKMTGISGIELLRELSQKLHPVQFIILSGYDDFDYVRGAFQSGAIDYLLKPILKEDLIRILSTAFSNLNRYPNISANLRETLFELSSDVLQEVAGLPPGTVPQPSLLSGLSNAGIVSDCCFSIVVSQYTQTYESMILRINEIYDHFDHILCNTLSENKIGILCSGKKRESLYDFLTDFIHTEDTLGSSATDSLWAASLTDIAPVSDLSRLFRRSEELLCLRLMQGYGHLFTEPEGIREHGFSLRLKHLISQFIETPSLITNDGLRTTFYKEIEELSLPDLTNFFHYFNEILGIAHFNNRFTNWDHKSPALSDFSSYADLEAYFYERLAEYAQNFSSQLHPSGTMDIVKDYIDLHYMDDLTLANLADHFFMSYSYLSKSFHKTFHMPFQKYLRMLRMEHALELLKKPELTLQQIASAVGYENAFNFSRSFKAEYGVSPSHFRNRTDQ